MDKDKIWVILAIVVFVFSAILLWKGFTNDDWMLGVLAAILMVCIDFISKEKSLNDLNKKINDLNKKVDELYNKNDKK